MNNQIIKKAIDLASDLGADQSDAILDIGNSLSLSSFQKKIDKYQISSSQILGIRIIKDKKIGVSYTESFDDASIKTMVENAIENSKFSSEDPYQEITLKGKTLVENSEKTYQEDSSTIDQKIEMTLKLEGEIIDGFPEAKAPYNGVAEGTGESFYLNSLGTSTYSKHSYSQAYTSALLAKDGKSAMHYRGEIGKSFSDIDPKECIKESLEIAKAMLSATPISTGKYDVIFTTNMLGDLISCFQSLFSGKSAMEGKNSFKDQLGNEVANSQLTITDSPRFEKAFDYSEFDSEGFEREDLAIIENGVLKSFLHNSITSKFFNLENNGRGARSAKSPLSISGTNMIIREGDASDSDLHQGTYLLINDLSGLHSGTNPISGDFSLGAAGILYKDGKEVQKVKEITVSGNFFKLLKDIKYIGSKTYSDDYRKFFAPKIRFNTMSIAGN